MELNIRTISTVALVIKFMRYFNVLSVFVSIVLMGFLCTSCLKKLFC